MKLAASLARRAFEVVYRVHKTDLDKVPFEGPLILYTNHTCEWEVPLLYTQLLPRPITALVKRELWDRRFLQPFLERAGAIPVRLRTADKGALSAALDALDRGKIVAIAPEGTLSGTGVLREAQAGVVALAARSGAPLMPLAHWGSERFTRNLRRGRRTDFHMRVGQPFQLDLGGRRTTHGIRRRLTDEVMLRLSALLPAQYRGVYSELGPATSPQLRPVDLRQQAAVSGCFVSEALAASGFSGARLRAGASRATR